MRVGLGDVGDVGPARLVDAQLVEQRAELAAVLGPSMFSALVPRIGTPGLVQPQRQVVRHLAAHADDDAVRAARARTGRARVSKLISSKISRSHMS